MKKAKLICTHGLSDLQLIARDNGKTWRVIPPRENVRQLHQWLLTAQPEPRIIEIEETVEECSGNWHLDTTSVTISGITLPMARDSTGAILLASPKLTRALTKNLSENGLVLRKALLLETRRDAGHPFAKKEPIATGHFLANYLREHYQRHDGSPIEVHCKTYLQEHEDLDTQDSPLAHFISARIESILRSFILDEDADATLLISMFGGIPPVKDIIAQAVPLIARKKVIPLFSSESGKSNLVQDHPSDALRARRIAQHHIRQAAFLEAFAVTADYHDHPEQQGWVDPLRQASRLVNANPIGGETVLPALQKILTLAQKASCLLVAMRIESALLNQRWLDAINGTVTFCESATIDAIAQIRSVKQFNPHKRTIEFTTPPPDLSSLLDNKSILVPDHGNRNDNIFRTDVVGKAINGWITLLDEPLKSTLETLQRRIYARPPQQSHNPAPFEYRNYNTHSILTQEEITLAISTFTHSRLWAKNVGSSTNPPTPGTAFLSMKTVQDLICALTGEKINVRQLFQDLLEQLEKRLVDPQHCFDAADR